MPLSEQEIDDALFSFIKPRATRDPLSYFSTLSHQEDIQNFLDRIDYMKNHESLLDNWLLSFYERRIPYHDDVVKSMRTNLDRYYQFLLRHKNHLLAIESTPKETATKTILKDHALLLQRTDNLHKSFEEMKSVLKGMNEQAEKSNQINQQLLSELTKSHNLIHELTQQISYLTRKVETQSIQIKLVEQPAKQPDNKTEDTQPTPGLSLKNFFK